MRSREYLSLTGAVLLTAFLAYAAASFSSGERPQTVTAELVTVSESIEAEGIVVRRELCVSVPDGLYVTAEDFTRVSGGSVIAADGAYLAARENELRLAGREAARELPSGVIEREKAVESAVIALSSAKSVTERRDASIKLSALLGFAGRELRQTAYSGGRTLSAPCAGLYLSRTDGFEDIDPASLYGVGAKELRRILDSQPEPGTGVKLIPSGDTYFAAVIPSQDAQKLDGRLTVTLGGIETRAKAEYVSEPENGQCAALLRCEADASQTASVRFVTARIECLRLHGIAIPRGALIRRDGGTFVRVLRPAGPEELAVDIIYENDDNYIAAESKDADGLRAGMEIMAQSFEV